MFEIHLVGLLAHTAVVAGGVAVIAAWATSSYCSPEARERRAKDVALQQLIAANHVTYAPAYARVEETPAPAEEELGTFQPRIWWELICVTVAALAGRVFRQLRDAAKYTGSHRVGQPTTRKASGSYDELMGATS